MVRTNVLKGFYEIEKTIGCGGFAKVKVATHVLTGEKVAIKIMEKKSLGEDLHRVTMEIQALKRLSHHHISKLYQVIETETHYFLIMEYCAGGELFDHIVSKDRLGEGESRSFFRQIVSAVAYLHQQGYVHRDLKPENILLDRDQVLKLIDFGLCAQPSGGMGDHLFTSCGSPTYAAPELVLGQKYLGSEVDVWSMGVLLYALLCGCLPFDDKNITNLYKKILNGKYDEPTWLSIDTRKLIRSMLQVDPKKRISINELLCHPWLMLGYGDPVISDSLYEFQEREDECLLIMSKAYDITPDQMWRRLCRWRYDYDTATYQLLRTRKKRGAPLKLSSTTTKSLFRSRIFSDNVNIDMMHGNKHKPLYHCNTHSDLSSKENAHQDTPDFKKYCSRNYTYAVPKENQQASIERNETYIISTASKQSSVKKNETYVMDNMNKRTSNKETFIPLKHTALNETFILTNKKQHMFESSPTSYTECSSKTPVAGERDFSDTGSKFIRENENFQNFATPFAPTPRRRSHKRYRSPVFEDTSPVPSKMTPSQAKARACGQTESAPERCSSARSGCFSPIGTPNSSRKVLDILQDGLHKMRHVLTPRKKIKTSSALQPTMLATKGLCNVSTTVSHDPERVLQQLQQALIEKGILCSQEGFKLRGKVQESVSSNNIGTNCKLSFELEVCTIPSMSGDLNGGESTVVIQRKRLKGDTWFYKKICEEVLALAATE